MQADSSEACRKANVCSRVGEILTTVNMVEWELSD